MDVRVVVGQLLLQQKHLGFELVPFIQDVPQLLQGEARAVASITDRVLSVTTAVLSQQYRLKHCCPDALREQLQLQMKV